MVLSLTSRFLRVDISTTKQAASLEQMMSAVEFWLLKFYNPLAFFSWSLVHEILAFSLLLCT
jgi:hypothetical protein